MFITKANGKKVKFDTGKLRVSLSRSGATEDRIRSVVSEITAQLYDGIPTKLIYKNAFALLKASSNAHAGRYKVKQALKKLSTTGYPFEHFIGKLLEKQGFATQVGVVVPGKCVQHEVDVFALKQGKHFMVECKFHYTNTGKCDVKTALYVHARFRDLEAYWKKQPGHETRLHQGWLVTNTRFTTDAIDYGTCAGMQLLSWDFPQGNSLRELIARYRHYPITCISTLKNDEITMLTENAVVIADDIVKDPTVLDVSGISENRKRRITDEARMLIDL